MKKLIYTVFTVAVLATFLFTSCSKDALEPSMDQDKLAEGGVNNIEDVEGVLYGAYNRMTQTPYYGRDVIIYGEIRADNAFANGNSGRFTNIGRMDMLVTDAYARDTWTDIYEVIASCNILVGLNPADIDGDVVEINHYIGQAYALRALAHFDLLKLFGQQHVTAGGNIGVPYIIEYNGDDLTPLRNTSDEVKGYIEADLATSLTLMTDDENDASKQFMTTYGAYALQSRVALYFGEWAKVISAAEAVINSVEYQIIAEADFVGSWVADGAVNSIFELAYSSTDNNNINGLSQIYRGAAYGDIQGLQDLYDAFDAGDVRASAAMIGPDPDVPTKLYTNLGKYPSYDYSDNISLIRYEEVILNYAEALFENGDAVNSLAQLNAITSNRGALPYAVATKANILLERRRELCFEGFRHDDLARTGMNIPEVSAFEQTHGGPDYGSYNFAFPIPEVEINANSNMTQNDGYN